MLNLFDGDLFCMYKSVNVWSGYGCVIVILRVIAMMFYYTTTIITTTDL